LIIAADIVLEMELLKTILNGKYGDWAGLVVTKEG